MKILKLTDNTPSHIGGKIKASDKIDNSPHLHRQVELLYTLEGSLNFLVADKEQRLFRGELAVIKSFSAHQITATQKNGLYLIIILPDVLSASLTSLGINNRIFKNIDNHFKNLIESYSDYIVSGEAFKALYFNVCSELIKSLYGIDKKENLSEIVLNYIGNHYFYPITLDDVSKNCNTNRSYVSKIVNGCSGVNFSRYVNKLRLAEFIRLYRAKNVQESVQTLLSAVGFSNARSFYRVFEREIGCPPKKYFSEVYGDFL